MRVQPGGSSLWIAVLKGSGLGLALLVAFVAGFVLREGAAGTSSLALAGTGPRFVLLEEARQLLEQYYLRPLPDSAELEYAAIRGMLGSLGDPYTFFNLPAVTRSESDALAGQYGGIGVDIQLRADGQFVLYPYADGPAAAAGIQDGDILVAVDQQLLASGISVDEIRQLLRGQVGDGNGVSLVVRKHETGDEQLYAVEFAIIAVPSVTWRPLLEAPHIGYIQVNLFTGRTPEEIRVALEGLREAGVLALIVDLRNNPGGLLQESIQAADEFLAGGVIYYEESRDSEREQVAQRGGQEPEVPIMVLVNRHTASAAELVAGALQANDRAVVIGQATSGKGSVQLIFPLSDGSSLHITSAEWYTPDRVPLSGNGLQPDIPMIPAEDGRDVEMDEAIRRLQQQVGPG